MKLKRKLNINFKEKNLNYIKKELSNNQKLIENKLQKIVKNQRNK